VIDLKKLSLQSFFPSNIADGFGESNFGTSPLAGVHAAVALAVCASVRVPVRESGCRLWWARALVCRA
jgi:hypothetical protein